MLPPIACYRISTNTLNTGAVKECHVQEGKVKFLVSLFNTVESCDLLLGGHKVALFTSPGGTGINMEQKGRIKYLAG